MSAYSCKIIPILGRARVPHVVTLRHKGLGFSSPNSTMGQDCRQATGTPEAVLIDFYATLEECLFICNFSMQWTSGVLLCIASGKLPTIKPIFMKKKEAKPDTQNSRGKEKLKMIQASMLFEHLFLCFYLSPPPKGLMRKA